MAPEKASKAVEGHQEERAHLVQARHTGLQRQIAQCPGAAGPGGPTVQGAAKAPGAIRGVLELAWDNENGDSEEEDGDEDEEAVSDVVAVRDHVVLASVALRARALLRLIRKTDVGRRPLTWSKHTHELVLNGRPMIGRDIFHLVVHVTRDRRSKRPKVGSCGPPPGFDRFARGLRTLGVAAG